MRSGTGPKLGRRCPYLALDEDWALFTTRGGALFADRIVTDLAGLLARRGVELRPHCRAAEIDAERATVVTAEGQRLTADAMIVAAGGWSGKLLPELAPDLQPKRAIIIYLEPPLTSRPAGREHLLSRLRRRRRPLPVPADGRHAAQVRRRLDQLEPRRTQDAAPDEPERLLAGLRPYIRDLDRYRFVDHRVCMYCSAPTSASWRARWPMAGWPAPPAVPGRCSSSARSWASSWRRP